MNTLGDLRSTLRSHAPSGDDGLSGRVTAVRTRVQVVRRRRRASAVIGALAAVAVVAAGVALPRLVSDQGDPGLAAAPSVTFGGFDYGLVKVVRGEPGQKQVTAAIERPERGSALVVLLARNLAGGSATIRTDATLDSPGRVVDRILEDGAGRPVPVDMLPEPEEVSDLQADAEVDAEGAGPRTELGIAIYQRTAAMPPGVVDATGSTVFRQQVGGRRLLAGAFVEPGGAEQTIRFTGALADVRIDDFCSVPGHTDEKRRPWIHVSVDDGVAAGGSCGSPEEDGSQGGSYFPDLHEVKAHTLRVWISPTERGPATPVADAVVGVAVYAPGATRVLHGSTVDEVVESDGRTWQLDRVIESVPGAHRIEASWSGLRDHLLVGYAVERTRRVTTGGSIPGGGSVDGTADKIADQHSSSLGGVVLPGDDASFSVSWPAKYASASGAILVYRPLT